MVRRRLILLVALCAVAVLAAIAVLVARQLYLIDRDLHRAQSAADRLRSAIADDDQEAQRRAIDDLRQAADGAADHASGPLVGALTHAPVVGDDVRGVRVLSTTLSDLAEEGIEPLLETREDLDSIVANGRVDVDRLAAMQGSIVRAHRAFDAASDEIGDVDSSGFVDRLRHRFDDYAEVLDDASSALAAADTAARVVPHVVGADGPVSYLLIFQNNSEIRATGGMAGAWALVHADRGELTMEKQGTGGAFPHKLVKVLPLSHAERELYGARFAKYFQRSNSTPDFPRAAAIWREHWDKRFREMPIDGIIAFDPVAMSYLLDGIGPLEIDGRTLEQDTLVPALLNQPYFDFTDNRLQDAFLARTARSIFDDLVDGIESPASLVDGLRRAAGEGRLLVSSFDDSVQAELEGTDVVGEFRTEPSRTPYVDIGIDALNGTKMSYYLRYDAVVEPRFCPADRQQMDGTVTLHQVISRKQAMRLPTTITGTVKDGQQWVGVGIYGPVGGTITDIRLDGVPLDAPVYSLDGRPAARVQVEIDSIEERAITWSMETGPDQTGDVELWMTPGILPGPNTRTFAGSCG